jgi:hypothetical protein
LVTQSCNTCKNMSQVKMQSHIICVPAVDGNTYVVRYGRYYNTIGRVTYEFVLLKMYYKIYL